MKKAISVWGYILVVLSAISMGLAIPNIGLGGDCVKIAKTVYDRGIRWGYPMRLVSGWTDEGTPHRWAEYYVKGNWRVWDDSIWYIQKSWSTAKELGYKTKKVLK